MNYSVVKIPVSSVTKKYYEKRFGKRMDDRGYIKLDKNTALGMKVIHYLDLWWNSWELPKVESTHIKIKLPTSYLKYGIPSKKLIELSKILEMEAMEYLVHEIACAAQYPGISVTDAIITVMGRYDISEEEYRTDSMRRHFDRYCEEILGDPFKEFSHQINFSIKQLYERMIAQHRTFDQISHV